MRHILVLLLFLAGASVVGQAQASDDGSPLLVILTETGESRDGLPVLTRHPAPDGDLRVLTRGFSGRLLRLFRYVQQFRARASGTPIEPAYLLRSSNEGGFPRVGFFLDDAPKRDVAYVDLHRRSQISGRFGAVDQIFPHELLHVIVRQLAGEAPDGGANQVHAVGVRTDPVVAFNEGFAEHAQIMAIEDGDAAAATSVLKDDRDRVALATSELDHYAHALSARWSVAPRARLAFPLWFSPTEQTLRYHAVKNNLFAHEVDVPSSLLAGGDPYLSYLYENVIPGDAARPFKPATRLCSTEGAVAAVFYRWVTATALQTHYLDDGFYERFGIVRSAVGPLENVYLKLFGVLATRNSHDLAAFVREYIALHQEEAAAVQSMLRANGLTVPATPAPELWLESGRLRTGTTLFDQYRALPRNHTFDLNAASITDLLSVDGIGPELAGRIAQSGPFSDLKDVVRVTGVTPAVVNEMQQMAGAMQRSRASAIENQVQIDLYRIFGAMALRAVWWLLVASLACGLCYRIVYRVPRRRWMANGFAAAVIALTVAWIFVSAPWQVLAAPATVCGVPGALWALARKRPATTAATIIAAWLAAALPALLISQPLF